MLRKQQEHIAQRCETLVSGLAHVGIIALVDEATGYQAIRDRHALNAILDKYLRPYEAQWAKRFPDEFYQEIFRLKGWQWQGMKVNRPQVVGKYINNIVIRAADRWAAGTITTAKPETYNRQTPA